MTLNEIRDRVKRDLPIKDLLEKAPKGGFVCPHCGSGTGKNQTGAVKVYDTNTYFCHACNKGGDVIYLYQQQQGAGYKKTVEDLGARLGLYLDQRPDAQSAFSSIPDEEPVQAQTAPPAPVKETAPQEKDFSAYYEKCMYGLTSEGAEPAITYLESTRGIRLDLALDFRIGYDPESDPANTGHPTPRIIIPTSDHHYIARRIDGNPEFKVMNPKGCRPGIFNMEACYKESAHEVFVVEGAFDALSIIAAGIETERYHDALALNSTAQTKAFLEAIEKRRPDPGVTFILCLDNDQAGRNAQAVLSAGLHRLGISFIQADICNGAKDANEAWTRNKQDFVEAIDYALTRTAARPDNVSLYIDNFMGGDIEHFKQERKTGFLSFDLQTGGLYPGLYVLAAISSLGKTSFALQMADQLAASGEDVLFFSLEMSRLELVSKSLARTIAQESDRNISSMDIRKGKITEEVMSAAQRYKETVGERLSIVEANFDLNISSICDYVRRYIAKNDTRPAVFLDYLQILQPKEDDSKKQRREALDNTVTELKRFSREIDAPVFVISSVNRANYATPIAFESLKESGGIEYSADVVLGMQLQCLREDLFTSEGSVSKKRKRIEEEKKANPRKIELVCLKNRFGISSFSCFYEYFPRVDLFVDKESASIVPQELKKRSVVI